MGPVQLKNLPHCYIRRSSQETNTQCIFSGFALTLHKIHESEKKHDPLTYQKKVSGPTEVNWREFMAEKLDGISEKGVWSLKMIPTGTKAIRLQWVL